MRQRGVDRFGLDIRDNYEKGKNREEERVEELKEKYSEIQRECYLRDAKGNIKIDEGFTGEARRIDIVVIEDKKIVHIEEVTSLKARKVEQEEKTRRIRENGPTYIRDRKTNELILLPKRKKIKCHRRK